MPFKLKTGNLKIKDSNGVYQEVNTLVGDTSDAAIAEIKAAAQDIVANVEGTLSTQLLAAINNSTTQAQYAKEQGDYAKSQGDYAKNQGDYAKNKIDNEVIPALNAAHEATTAANTAAADAQENNSAVINSLNQLTNDNSTQWNLINSQWNNIKMEWDSNDVQAPGLKQQSNEKIEDLANKLNSIDTIVNDKLGEVLNEDFNTKLQTINDTLNNIQTYQEDFNDLTDKITVLNNNIFAQAQDLFAGYFQNALPISTVDFPALLNVLATWQNNLSSGNNKESLLQAILLGIKHPGTQNFTIPKIYPTKPLISCSWYNPDSNSALTIKEWYQKQGRWFDLKKLTSAAEGYNMIERGDILTYGASQLITGFALGKYKTVANNKIQYVIILAQINNNNVQIQRWIYDNSLKTLELIRPLYIQNLTSNVPLLPIFYAQISSTENTPDAIYEGKGLDIITIGTNPDRYVCIGNFIPYNGKSIFINWPTGKSRTFTIFGYDEHYNFLDKTNDISINSDSSSWTSSQISFTINGVEVIPKYLRFNFSNAAAISLTDFNSLSIIFGSNDNTDVFMQVNNNQLVIFTGN